MLRISDAIAETSRRLSRHNHFILAAAKLSFAARRRRRLVKKRASVSEARSSCKWSTRKYF
ncbi:MAG: hypothetical protein DYH05_07455 [Acidobacteria bacterium ACB1]|nr:hypothetical protein [Acidobacteria bacterium ACB1]